MYISKFFNRYSLALLAGIAFQTQNLMPSDIDETIFLNPVERSIAKNQTALSSVQISVTKETLWDAHKKKIPLSVRTINENGNIKSLNLPSRAHIIFSKNPETKAMEIAAIERLTNDSIAQHFKREKNTGTDLRDKNYRIDVSAGRHTQRDPHETASLSVRPAHIGWASTKDSIASTLKSLLEQKESRTTPYKPHPSASSFTQVAKMSTKVLCLDNKNGVAVIKFIDGNGLEITPEKSLFCSQSAPKPMGAFVASIG